MALATIQDVHREVNNYKPEYTDIEKTEILTDDIVNFSVFIGNFDKVHSHEIYTFKQNILKANSDFLLESGVAPDKIEPFRNFKNNMLKHIETFINDTSQREFI